MGNDLQYIKVGQVRFDEGKVWEYVELCSVRVVVNVIVSNKKLSFVPGSLEIVVRALLQGSKNGNSYLSFWRQLLQSMQMLFTYLIVSRRTFDSKSIPKLKLSVYLFLVKCENVYLWPPMPKRLKMLVKNNLMICICGILAQYYLLYDGI